MFNETSFQIINIHSISGQTAGLQSYCDTSYSRGGVNSVDSEKLKRSVRVHEIKVPLLMNVKALKHLTMYKLFPTQI